MIFGILLAWVGAGEAPAQTVLTGGALVIGALVVNELLGWKATDSMSDVVTEVRGSARLHHAEPAAGAERAVAGA